MRETTMHPKAGLGILSIVAMSIGLLGFGAGCSSAPTDGEDEATGSDLAELSRTDAVERADQWVHAKLQYCQAANHARDDDSSCSKYCSRTANAAWDAYRSDCSGLVSWAWGLPAPGRTTGMFAPFKTDITHTIPAEALQRGDAVNNDDHIMLFKQWVTPRKSAIFIEEPGCSSKEPYAKEITSNVSVSGSEIYVTYEGKSFTAIRYNNVKGEGAGSTSSDPPAKAPVSCHSDTLGKDVPNNTCVQTDDGAWYQCDGGNWVDRESDPQACSSVFPQSSSDDRGCYSDTLGKEMPDNACVQSATNKLWYQCSGGAWVDRWTDPEACDGIHAL